MTRTRSLAFLGFPNYKITDDGRVYSNRVYGSRLRRTGPWWEMKVMYNYDKDGRVESSYVNLYAEKGKQTKLRVPWLVMHAFVGPRPDGLLVCHKNDRPWDNRLENLYYGTHKSNTKDAVRNGRHPVGEDHYNATLNNAQVRRIKQMLDEGYRPRQIGRILRVNYKTVYKIEYGEIYREIV